MNNTLYLVIPCYNEEAVLHETASQLLNITKSMIEKEMISQTSKILFVNDGSKDKTWEIIEQLHKQNPIFCGHMFYQEIRGTKTLYLQGL